VQNAAVTAETKRSLETFQDRTRKDAKLFTKVILPLTTEYISSIVHYFEFYKPLSFEDWCEMLPRIVEETKQLKEYSQALKKMCEDVLGRQKRSQDDAKVKMSSYTRMQDHRRAMAEELEASANTKKSWKIRLAFVPGVNLIACPLLHFYQSKDQKQAFDHKGESRVDGAAVRAFEESLIPTQQSFVNGLCGIAVFFLKREGDLRSIQAHGANESLKEEHYKMIRNKVDRIQECYENFHDALPDIRTDIMALEDGDTHNNYINEWLEKMLPEIKLIISVDTQKAILNVIRKIPGLRLSREILFPSINMPLSTSCTHMQRRDLV
jgi:hypothetical protein